ncbi:hypothetical protein LZC95_14460 [Pendulispora brunnea]|uniref:Uncharacterized protein n=1 Tax=Pendulispora brunnea TaxID=2905690 RepID=A0ABZ2KLT5_9BACT
MTRSFEDLVAEAERVSVEGWDFYGHRPRSISKPAAAKSSQVCRSFRG